MREGGSKIKRKRRVRRPGQVLVRDRIEYALLRAFVWIVRALPIETASSLTGAAWRVFGPFTRRHRRALGNLAVAFPEFDEAARRKIAADQWENLGCTFAESFVIDRIVADPRRIALAISPDLDRRLRTPGGLVVVSLHSANWEVAALPTRRYRRVAGLYQRLTNPLVDPYVLTQRSHVFDGGLFSKGAKTAGRVMRWVREGNAVAMLVDGRESRGIDLTMFGEPARANPFPAMVARRLGTPLVAGRVVRLPNTRFRVEAVEVAVPVTDDPQADVAVAMQAVLNTFEAWIRERPGEWMWVQDRRSKRDRLRAADGVNPALPAAPE
jgi:KDO2-lipid IV(A) lauroyltransferase